MKTSLYRLLLIAGLLLCGLLASVLAGAQSTGDYRSVTSGGALNWNSTSSWQRYNGSTWATPTAGQGYPGQYSGTGLVTIQNASSSTYIVLNVSPANAIAALQVGTTGGGTSSNYGELRNAAGSYDLDITGNVDVLTYGRFNQVSVSGSRTYNYTIGGNISVAANGRLNVLDEETGNIILNGTNQTISGSGTISASSWTLSNNGIVNLNQDISTSSSSNAFVINANSTLIPDPAVRINPSSSTGTIKGTGTIYCSRISSQPTFTAQFRFSTNTLTDLTVNFSGLGDQSIASYTVSKLICSGSGEKTITGAVTANAGITIEAGTTLFAGSYTSNVGSELNIYGTLDFNNASGYFRTLTSGTTVITMGASGLLRTMDDNGLGPVNNASLQNRSSGTWGIGNSETVGTIEYYRTSSQTVTDRNYNNLVITGSNNKTWTPSATRTVNGNITIQGNFVTSGSRTIDLKGNWIKTSGNYAPNSTTINMNGAAAQTISGASSTSFYNLTVNQSPASTVTNSSADNSFNVTNSLTVTQGNLILQAIDADYSFNNVTVSTNGTLTHSVDWNAENKKIGISGNLDVTGIWNPTIRSHVSMTGTGTKTIRTGPNGSSHLSILTFASNGTFNQNGNLVTNQEVWGFFGVSGGTFNTGANTFTCTVLLNNMGTVNFSSGSTVNISDMLQVGYSTNAGTVNVASTAVVNVGEVLINVNGSFVCSGSPTINVNGNWTRNGSFTPANSAVNFVNSTGDQSFGGTVATQSFYDLGLAKGSQALTLGGSLTSLTVSHNLSLTSGLIAAGSIPVIVSNNGVSAVTSSGGYVDGRLQRAVTNTSGFLFPVGTAAGYTPVTYNFTSVTGTGSIAVQSKDGKGSLYPSTLNATKYLSRNWAVSKTGITAYTANASFNYLAGDLTGGAVGANLRSYIAAPALSYPSLTTSTNAFSVSGITTDGEIGAGECLGTLASTFTKTKASSCGTGNDGTISVTPLGGVTPYSYSWAGPGGYTANTANISSLGVGDYTMVITDLTGCINTIPDITILQALTPALTSNATPSASCVNDGTLTLYATLGVPPYQYSVDGINYQAGNVFTGLAGGNYTAYLKDSKGCIGTKAVTITTYAALNIIASSVRPSSVCGNNGILSIYPSGGNSPYSYSIDGINWQSGNRFENLGAGSYTGYVKDSKGCTYSQNFIIQAVTGMTPSSFVTGSGSCSSNGKITLAATGGRSPYTFSLDNVTYVASPVFTGLAGNQNYTGYIKDADGCIVSTNIFVSQAPAVTASARHSESSACVNDGSIQAVPLTGQDPFKYSLDGATFQNSNVFTGLAAGDYTLTVKDATGCTTTVDVSIGTRTIGASNLTGAASNCAASNGWIKILVTSAGVSPYTYSIDGVNYVASPMFNGITPGSYTGYVKDSKGCIATTNCEVGPACPRVPLTKMAKPIVKGNEFGNVYPNPSSGSFNIELNQQAKKALVQVTDITGQLVSQIENVEGKSVVQVGENWKPGVYFVKIIQDGEIKTIRLIKQ